MPVTSNYISASDVVATVDTTLNSKVLFLPGVSSIYGKILTVKDVGGNASSNTITLRTAQFDYFEGTGSRQEYIISNAYGSIQLLAKSNYWYFLNTGSGATNVINVGGGGGGDSSNTSNPGVSSLSSIVSYGLSTVYGGHGISSLSSIVAYGLSSIASGQGISSLSSIVAYGISSIQKGIERQVITSSLYANYISSGIADFSTISTQTLLVGYVTSPLQVDVGVETPNIYTSSVQSYKGFFEGNVGIGRKAPYWYALDVAGNVRISGKISGDGSQLNNLNVSNIVIFTPGVSSLSSIVAYGLSSLLNEVNIVRLGGSNPGVSSLSSIVTYGLSTVAGGHGVSSLSSIVAYGLSSINGGQGISSLSSIVSYGLSTVYGGAGVSSLSSIISYGLSSVAGGHGVSSLSSIVAYGLSSINGGDGVSSLSSIVAYGISSVSGGYGISSLSSIIAYGLSSLQKDINDKFSEFSGSNEGVSSLSSIVSYGLSTVYGGYGISSLSSIVAYGLSSLQKDIDDKFSKFSGSNEGVSSLSSIVAYGLSSLLEEVNIVRAGASNPGLSTLSSIVAYGLSSIQKGIERRVITSSLYANYISSGIADFSTISTQTLLVGYVTSPLQVDVGVETPNIYTSSIQSYKGFFEGNVGIGRKAPYWYALDVAGDVRFSGKIIGDGSQLRNLNVCNVIIFTPGVSSLSSIVAYGLSSLLNEVNIVRSGSSNPGLSTLSSIVSYGLSSMWSPDGISSLSSIVAYGLSTVSGAHGVSTLSSIISYGLSTVYGGYGVSSLSSIVAYGLSSLFTEVNILRGDIINPKNEGVSSLSSIVAYGLSTVYGGDGISSLSSIISYGLSTVYGGYGISSLSSIVAYGLSSLQKDIDDKFSKFSGSNEGVSSLSSIVAYGLSSLLNEVNIVRAGSSNPGLSTLSSIVAYGLSSIQKGIERRVITSSLYANYISSGIADFSTISTQTLLVGYVTSPLQVDVGVETPNIYTSSVQSYKGFFEKNLGIGRKAPYWYALDVAGDARFSGKIIGDGSKLSNIGIGNFELPPAPGVSSLSSIVAYGISSLKKYVDDEFIRHGGGGGSSNSSNEGVSSLSSIVAYGLSTVGLIQNPTVGAFIDESRGGTGISSLASLPEKPDTITDAVAKIDNWLFKNIIAQPPKPVQSNSDIQGTYAKLPLVPPFQIKSGVLNQWLPAIFSIQTDVYAKSNYSLISSIVLTNSGLLPKGESNFNGFYFDGQFITSCNISYFGYTNNGISNLYYIPLGSNLKINASYQIDIYYRNYSMEPVNILSNEWYIIRGFQPDAPYSLVLSNPTYDSIYTGFTLSNINCNNPSQGIGNGANYVDAFITLSNSITNPIPRRYGLGFDSYLGNFTVSLPSDATSNTYISCNISGLPADTYLSFNVYTKNSLNQNDGLISSNSYYSNTALPPNGGRLTSVTYNSDIVPNYPVSGIPVNGPRTNVVEVLCNSIIDAQGGFLNIINNGGSLAIHTIVTPGNSNTTPIASLQVTTATDSNTFFFTGWSDTLQSGGTSNSANSGIIVGAIQDVYPGSQYLSNFYLQASNVSVVISNAYFASAGASGVQFSIIGSNLSNANISNTSQTYYSDSLTGDASLAQFSNALDLSNAGRFQYITGVLSLTSNVIFDFKADVANWACNFYPACNTFLTASYSNGGINTKFGTSNLNSNTIIYDNTDSLALSGTVPNPARFQLSNTSFAGFGTILTSNTASQIVVTLKVNTLTTSEKELRCNIPYYFDIASINRINSPLGGTRFLALSNTYPSGFELFNNTCNITSNSENSYGYELPLLGGLYRSGGNLGVTYGNFTDFEVPEGFVGYEYPTSYSNILNETGIRFAMFKYSLTNQTTTHYVKLLEFNINSSVGFNNIGVNCNFDSRSISNLWYKIDNINSCNTGWLNGNSTRTTLASFNGLDANGNGIAGLRSNSCNTLINGVQRYFSIIPIAPSCNFDVYVKIGIKMNCNINFDYINISNIYGSNNPAPTSLRISNIGDINENKIGINWSNVDTIDLYTGFIAPILCNVGSITAISNINFPRRYGNYVIDDIQNFVLFGNSNNTELTALNYDTDYSLTIYSVNDLGTSTNPSVNSSSITYRTSLPNNSGPFYKTGNTFSILNTYNCNYFITDSIYTNSEPRNTINNVINMNQSFSIDGNIQIHLSNMPFTVNPESNRVGSNLSKVTFYLETFNNNIINNNLNFSFFTDSYSASEGQLYDASEIQAYITLIEDEHKDDINASNFFLKASDTFYYSLANSKITATNTPYKFIMSNDQGCNITSPDYYFDNFPTAARAGISNIFVDTSAIDSTYYSYVSGLAVFNTNCNYNLWIAASNLGCNFFINPPVTVRLVDGISDTILEYNFDIDSSKLYSNSNTESIMTGTVQNTGGQTFLYWSNVNLSNSYGHRPIFTVNNPFSNIGSASNLNGLSAAPTNFVFGDSSNRKFYFDSASVLVRDATKNSNYVSGAQNYGLRVESGAGLYPTLNQTGVTNDSLFGFSNIDSNLLTVAGGYSNELQLVNGQYTASNPGIAYLNYNNVTRNLYIPTGYSGYPDYSQIVTTSDRRYATFMWYIPSVNITNFIYFTINNSNFLTNTGADLYTLYTGGITVQYCIVKNNNYPPSPTNGTSAWLNGNVKCSSALPLSPTLWATNNTGGLLNGQTINGVTRNNDRSNRIVRINNNNNSVGSGEFNFFVRIGIPINCNFSFNNVKIEHVQTN